MTINTSCRLEQNTKGICGYQISPVFTPKDDFDASGNGTKLPNFKFSLIIPTINDRPSISPVSDQESGIFLVLIGESGGVITPRPDKYPAAARRLDKTDRGLPSLK
jgi:hypothetical protein